MKTTRRAPPKMSCQHRRTRERGLTLIELLLSIALLSILTAFLAGGISLSRRAFEADQASANDGELRATVQALSGLIGSAVPVQVRTGGQAATLAFEGHADALTFVGLSDGRGLRGGLYRIAIRRSGQSIFANFKSWSAMTPPQAADVTMLDGIRDIRLRYYGNPKQTGVPRWYDNWENAENLPDLVSMRIDREAGRSNAPVSFVAALRQR